MGIRRPKKSQRTLACLVAAAGSVAGLTLAAPAIADEPRKVTEPKVLREPGYAVRKPGAQVDNVQPVLKKAPVKKAAAAKAKPAAKKAPAKKPAPKKAPAKSKPTKKGAKK